MTFGYALQMFERILVALDGSPSSDAALDRAVTLARGTGRRIVCCHALDLADAFDPALLIESRRTRGEALLAAAAAKAEAAGVPVATSLLVDSPVAAILREAQECGAELIVMGTQGRTGIAHMLLGSTTESVMRTSTVPVMTVRATGRLAAASAGLNRILIAVDDSDPADAAVALGLALGRTLAARLLFCTVIPTADLFDKAAVYGYDPQPLLDDFNAAAQALIALPLAQAKHDEIDAEAIVREGKPVTQILKAAAMWDAQLVLIGSHGRRSLQRLFVGSIVENVARQSSLPVLVVRTVPASMRSERYPAIA